MADDELSFPRPDPGPPPSRELDVQMLERVEGDLADVEAVLPKIDDGTYGTCEACGAAIPDEILASAPATRLCVAHSV
jgi:RNA polymerase-binding transcription factor DksA